MTDRGAASQRGPGTLFAEVPEAALVQARRIARETRHRLLIEVLAGRRGEDPQLLNNALMDVFRVHGRVDAFGLLFELNARPFASIATRVMRMTGCRADINDVVQEAFLAIYRYPTKFCPDQPHSFRNWAYSIIRNTVYRHAQAARREGIPVEILADVLVDEGAASPPQATEDAESEIICRRVYELLLRIYSHVYAHELKPRDRHALHLVEIDRLPYREAAEQLGVRLENFKMIVCRARKKLLRGMICILGSHPS